jgi:flagellar motor switch protein FliM
MALARASRDKLKLPLDVQSLSLAKVGLTEVLEVPPERALVALLEGPGEGVGVIVLSADVLQAMVEVLTMGRVGKGVVPARKPTRTDAAMVAEVIDAALIDMEAALAQEADLIWAGGWRYASFLDDPRPLGLLLEDTSYRLLRAEVTLGLGARQGGIFLAVPAEGRGKSPARATADPGEDVLTGPAFSMALAAQIEGAECTLDAVLSRISLPLSRILGLKIGEVLDLPRAALDKVSFEGLDGRKLAEGKLGQNRGMRALRMGGALAPAMAANPAPAAVAPAPEMALRQTA